MSAQSAPQITYLKNYTLPEFEIHSIDLIFELNETDTTVTSCLQISRLNAAAPHASPDLLQPLTLNGEDLTLLSVTLDGQTLSNTDYTVNNTQLIIHSVPDKFTLVIQNRIYPALNTKLEGLYKVNQLYCTQCEAQGFRRITYYLDRPDVMSVFTTTIIADKSHYPVLLSNGNLIHIENLAHNKHKAQWSDPFKKPSYLFALVAGNLACIEDHFITQSGRRVTIHLYVDHGDEDKTAFALQSIKKAMKWDEDNFGREYDLDIFMVVATHDFNMGAMENKGLNIFNAKYILAHPDTATDDDYIAIERVIGHEYFHNWTGDRITCRDWFQLSIKEGLTVFRDARFSADMTSPAVVRINDVNTLRSVQFPQDASPMAHPVQPKSYMEINNFYTVTIYEKGAEIIHMLYILLGKKGFRTGMDLYFERHDGQAVCIEDFIQAHSDANQKDLSQFMQWYHEAGTPLLNIMTHYNENQQQFILKIEQQHPCGKPFYLPFKMGLLNTQGKEITAKTLEITQLTEEFIFDNIPEKPIISLLRDFSAPVKIAYDYTDQELAFLLSYDQDPVAQWDAGQQLGVRLIKAFIQDNINFKNLLELLLQSYQKILENKKLDPALSALLLVLPNEHYLIEQIDCSASGILDKLFQARKSIRFSITQRLEDLFLEQYQTAADTIGGRAIKNRCLSYLGLLNQNKINTIIYTQFITAKNMTDEISALSILANSESDQRTQALGHFYQKYSTQPLVIDKWFSLQARAEIDNVLDQVKKLLLHQAFSLKNPNKVRALISAFTQNLSAFHDISGTGYQFLTEQIIALNMINPIITAKLCEPFSHWKKYDIQRQALITACLNTIKNLPNLSKNVYEIVSKSLSAV